MSAVADAQYQQTISILKAVNPDLDFFSLHVLARMIMEKTNSVIENSKSLEEVNAYIKKMQQYNSESSSDEKRAELESTRFLLKKEKVKFLQAHNVNMGDAVEEECAEKLVGKFTQSLVQSIYTSKKKLEERCGTCATPNRLIDSDKDDAHYLLKKCSRCRKMMYCSTECQRKDWPRHKVACIKLEK